MAEFLPLQADGYSCTTEQLLDVLLAVSAQKDTIEQVCDWTTSPNAAYRFMLIGMSFLLTNLWQELQSQWTRKAQVGE